MVNLDVDSVVIKTNCVHCGQPIEKKGKIHKGKELIREEMLKKEEIDDNDPYLAIHMLCDRCDLLFGAEEEAKKNI